MESVGDITDYCFGVCHHSSPTMLSLAAVVFSGFQDIPNWLLFVKFLWRVFFLSLVSQIHYDSWFCPIDSSLVFMWIYSFF